MKKVLLAAGLIAFFLIAMCFVAIYCFPQITYPFLMRYEFPKKDYALLYDKPVHRNPISLPASSIFSNNATFACGNLVFKTVWQKARRFKKKAGYGFAWFPDSKALIINKPAQIPPISQGLREASKDDKHAEKIFSKQELKSNYLMHKQVIESSLAATPRNRVELMRMFIFTPLKAISYPDVNAKGVYSFETNVIRGWQFGTPRGKHDKVDLSFYDHHDVFYEILAVGMTQKEIDIIIRTMRER